MKRNEQFHSLSEIFTRADVGDQYLRQKKILHEEYRGVGQL